MKKLMLIMCCVMCGGCATIVNTQHQTIMMTSNPPSKITVEAVARKAAKRRQFGVKTPYKNKSESPSTQQLLRGDEYLVTFEAPQCETKEVRITRHLSWWLLGNVAFGGPFGLLADVTGSGGYKLRPKALNVELICKEIGTE